MSALNTASRDRINIHTCFPASKSKVRGFKIVRVASGKPERDETEVGEQNDEGGAARVAPDGVADHPDHDHAQGKRDEPHPSRNDVRMVGKCLGKKRASLTGAGIR